MSASGLERSLRLLMRSANPAATAVLVAALDAPDGEVRIGAVRAIANREDRLGHRELLASLGRLPGEVSGALYDVSIASPMARGLGGFVRADTPRLALRAARVAADWGVTDAIAAVVEAAYWAEESDAATFGACALTLAGRLDRQLHADAEGQARSAGEDDPAFARRAAVNALVVGLRRYAARPMKSTLEALTLLAPADEPELCQALADRHHAAHDDLIALLQRSTAVGALTVLATAFTDSRAPDAVAEVVATRTDAAGLDGIFRRVGPRVGLRTRENCRRMPGFAWLDEERADVVLELTEASQAIAVQVAAASGASRRRVAALIKRLLIEGAPAAQVAAARAIDALPKHLAVDALVEAIDHESASVAAVGAELVRKKDYPNANATLVAMLDHPDEAVRRAAQKGIRSASYADFRDSFDELSPLERVEVGGLVGRADPLATATLRQELRSGAAGRRLKAMEMIELLDLVGKLLPELCDAAADRDVGVRVEAVRLLGVSGDADAVTEVLVEACGDRSSSVREAALKALQTLGVLGPQAAVLEGAP